MRASNVLLLPDPAHPWGRIQLCESVRKFKSTTRRDIYLRGGVGSGRNPDIIVSKAAKHRMFIVGRCLPGIRRISHRQLRQALRLFQPGVRFKSENDRGQRIGWHGLVAYGNHNSSTSKLVARALVAGALLAGRCFFTVPRQFVDFNG